LLAERLSLDIIPIIIHGAGDCLSKGENFLKSGSLTLKICPRVKPGDVLYGKDYHEGSKSMLAFYRQEYAKMREELETPDYFRYKVIRNYVYKGPVIEWYVRVKLWLENNYNVINRYVPRNASVVDIGCGYGYLSYMLGFVSECRNILGIDYDTDKIELAGHCISKNERVRFVAADALEFDYPFADVFILSDVLHYMPYEQQEKLLETCISRLNPGGRIIIRDADSGQQKKHNRTRLTEFYSTRTGFNKSKYGKLFFLSEDHVRRIAEKHQMKIETSAQSRFTSNILMALSSSF
jgi:SAM-dependent methyltransferase